MECTETLVLAAVLNRFLVPRAQSKALNETRVMDFLSKTVDKNDFWPIFNPKPLRRFLRSEERSSTHERTHKHVHSSSPSLLSPSAAPHPRLLGQLIGYTRHLLHPSAHGSCKNDCHGFWLLIDPWRAALKIPWPVAWC